MNNKKTNDDELVFADEESVQKKEETTLAPWKLLIVDDEKQIHQVSEMVLKNFNFGNRPLQFINAISAAEAKEKYVAHPDIAVVLLDVVMETDHAGLDFVKYIRDEVKNSFVRIILRTGQPGIAPEQETIETYDIDGYLPKADLSSNKLFASVRTALRAFETIKEVEKNKNMLGMIHSAMSNLHSYESLDQTIWGILQVSVQILPTDLAIFSLTTYGEEEGPKQFFMRLSSDPDLEKTREAALALASDIATNEKGHDLSGPSEFNNGYYIPLSLHQSLGSGYLFLDKVKVDQLAGHGLSVLAQHASNILYSSVAQKIATDGDSNFYDSLKL